MENLWVCSIGSVKAASMNCWRSFLYSPSRIIGKWAISSSQNFLSLQVAKTVLNLHADYIFEVQFKIILIHRVLNLQPMRLKTFCTYDHNILNFFCDPILFAICTSKLINILVMNQAVARTISIGASGNTGLPHTQASSLSFTYIQSLWSFCCVWCIN
jgi:hypothetical protein